LSSDGKTVMANRAAFQACLFMGLVFCAAAIAVYVFLLRGAALFPRDGSGLVVGRDF
jgi:ABC-type nickel/cobalt efflux system permease component RcnA